MCYKDIMRSVMICFYLIICGTDQVHCAKMASTEMAALHVAEESRLAQVRPYLMQREQKTA